MCDFVMHFSIFEPLDHTIIAGLPSDDIQQWKYAINEGSGISVIILTKLLKN